MTKYRATDVGNSERLADAIKDDVYYCPDWTAWVFWDGRVWSQDLSGAKILQLTKEVISVMRKEARDSDNDRLIKHAERSEYCSRIQGMIKLCSQHEGVSISSDKFDTNPMLLNCINGVVDLTTGNLLPHDRHYMMSRIVPVAYNRSAPCPRWRKFVSEIMLGDREIAYFLQKALGYSLTGNTREQCMFVLHGDGANGKSTLIETVRLVLGDYSRAADPMVFTTTRQNSVRTDLVHLRGSRFVSAVELNQDVNVTLDAALVKQMSGSDTISARVLFSNIFFEFIPTWKVWLSTNALPYIPGTDQGIWRRIRVIKFGASFEGLHADNTLGAKLAEEQEGILAWLIEGCMRWYTEGLKSPSSVQIEADTYREDLDPLGGFIRDKCLVHKDAIIPVSELYSAYLDWCKKENERPIGKYGFSKTLKSRRGIEQDRSSATRFWMGICLGRQSITRVRLTSVTPEEGNKEEEDIDGEGLE
jgi:putative DNA primase/helicase